MHFYLINSHVAAFLFAPSDFRQRMLDALTDGEFSKSGGNKGRFPEFEYKKRAP